jgi:hypothetical protein
MLGIHGQKIFTGLIATLAVIFIDITPVQADEATPSVSTTSNASTSTSASYLKDIRDYTYAILAKVNSLPAFIKESTKLALSWLAPDNSASTAALQRDFTTLYNVSVQNTETQKDYQKTLLNDFFTANKTRVPHPNDLTYQTLLKQPYLPFVAGINRTPQEQEEEAVKNYVQYASSLNIAHLLPTKDDTRSANAYRNFYQTVSAVQTFNGYILSSLYADYKNNNAIKKTQDSLVKQASDSDWFTQIASENMGVVLRQILLYNSQVYVLLTQLLETQKKLLISQAMNNSLLIANSQVNEGLLYTKAGGSLD